MFLTFESSQPNNKNGLRNPKQTTTRRSERLNRRRRSTPRACTSCRQRKIRCDGEKPCEACQWYKKAEQCSYPERERERESHSEETSSLPDYRAALGRLFPETAPESLVGLSRERLLALISKPTDGSPYNQHSQHQDSSTIATSASVETHVSALSMERPGLESLHAIPGEHEQLDENQCASASEESEEQISDDVNALSLPARNLTSYLGVSSIQAALKVIAWLHPQLNSHLPSPKEQRHPHHRSSISAGLPPTELQLLDAYFENFQPFSPLLDEDTCRSTFISGRRNDDRWLALLNIILALGSITAAGVDNHNHRAYFERSMSFLNLKVLGNPSLEVVQTLGLMGGWYCHYISQPNMGYALMGASLRMAVTLGLQREPPFDSHSMGASTARSGYQEFKRRVWWSLCCMETWGQETLGRPSMDFFGPSITVKLPHLLDKENYMKALPLIENVQFIKIASKIQESLAALPSLTHTELLNLDSQLLQWWKNLPPVLKDYNPCPDALYAVRTVMRWRFYNQRILLYRPRLLNYAMRRIPLIAIKDEERLAVQRCREIAEMAIEDISAATAVNVNQMIAWNAVWLIFQASMVPLICLSVAAAAASAGAADNDDDVERCKAQIQTAIATLDRMRPYGHTAERSLGMISSIFETVIQAPENTGLMTINPATNHDDSEMQTQNHPPILTENQPITRERVLDWTATTAATTGAVNTSFENYSSQHMWEYLSWGENNDFWAEMYTSLNPQEQANFFIPT